MADRYWRGGSGTWDTTTTTNWSTTSGGGGGASVPTAADNVIFDQAGPYTVTLTGALTCLSFTASASSVTFTSTGTITVSGSWSVAASNTFNNTGTITFNSTTAQTITSNGVTFSNGFTFNGAGGSWALQDSFTTGSARTITLTTGTINLNDKTLTCGLFSSNTTGVRTIAFGAGNITVTGSGTTWTTSTVTNLTITGTPVVNVTNSTSNTTNILPGALSESNAISFVFSGTGGAIYGFLGSAGHTAKNVTFTSTFVMLPLEPIHVEPKMLSSLQIYILMTTAT